MNRSKVRVRAGLVAGCGLILLASLNMAACQRHLQSRSQQVVAKVNDREITISQLNQALDFINPETLTPDVTKRALESLIDEELLVQAALQNKLDRDATTVAAFEHARRQILAQTYAERMLYPKSPVPLAAAEKYYKRNPALFENRRLYRLTMYSMKLTAMNDMLRAELNGAHSADQVRAVLEKHEVKYETQHLNSMAEDLPLDKVAQFAAASVGDLLIAEQRDGTALLISIVNLEQVPLSFESAKYSIEQYLTKTRNTEALQEHLRMTKAAAHISYVGQFAQFAASGRK